MRRTIALCFAAPLAAYAAPYPFTLSGDRFLEMMRHPDPSGYAYLLREKAYSYLDGARDSAEGQAWCDVNQLKTPDLADALAEDIARLPAAERKKNAAVLLLQLLKRRYPCRHEGKS